MHIIVSAIMTFFYFLLFWLLGLYGPSLNGEYITVTIALLLWVALHALGDRIFMVVSHSKEVRLRGKIADIFNNRMVLEGIGKVKVYKSYDLPANAYLLKSPFGKSSIIISQKLIENMSENEIGEILEITLKFIKKENNFIINNLAFIMFFFLVPKTIFHKLKLYYFEIIYNFIILPLTICARVILGSLKKSELEVIDVQKYQELIEKIVILSEEEEGILANISKYLRIFTFQKETFSLDGVFNNDDRIAVD